LDGLGFEETLGLELGVELGAVLLVGGEIVFGKNDGLAGEAVAQGVEPDPAFAFGDDGTGRAGSVPAVDGGSGFFSETERGMRLDSWKHLNCF